MTLKEFKDALTKGTEHTPPNLLFKLEDGTIIPPYFHITEMGMKTKNFVDCGGIVRTEQYITFQIWTADDFEHRLSSPKLLELIFKNEGLFKQPFLEVEMEYQTNTIGTYSLNVDPTNELIYILTPKKTNCLAPDKCGITQDRKLETNQPAKRQCGPSCC